MPWRARSIARRSAALSEIAAWLAAARQPAAPPAGPGRLRRVTPARTAAPSPPLQHLRRPADRFDALANDLLRPLGRADRLDGVDPGDGGFDDWHGRRRRLDGDAPSFDRLDDRLR